ncbi:class I SAM-dependent methyltransferase [Nesterenkonia populi]|uniref:class I SAM-dependent methyltransferase n=1 Tax=Nesterenkonia populi TaxID=1591087 RepID=UPI0011BECB97|nr:class I SAM-dependent methyltransferase [Nesterenkonia populi]
MSEGFDREFWKHKWGHEEAGRSPRRAPHPYLLAETAHLVPGRALDAGCGQGAEAIALAQAGWHVTGADISAEALGRAAQAAADQMDPESADRLEWVEADLTAWRPQESFDLVATSYAHSTVPQTELYLRIADWVTPGGTLLIVGHTHEDHGHLHGASAALAEVAALFRTPGWNVESAYETSRTASGRALYDVVLRARRTQPG